MSSFRLQVPAEPLACAMKLMASLEPRVGSPLMFSWTSPSRRLRVKVMPGRTGLGWLHLTAHPTSHQGLWFWSSGGWPPQKQPSFPRGREIKETGLPLSLSAASLSLGARSCLKLAKCAYSFLYFHPELWHLCRKMSRLFLCKNHLLWFRKLSVHLSSTYHSFFPVLLRYNWHHLTILNDFLYNFWIQILIVISRDF